MDNKVEVDKTDVKPEAVKTEEPEKKAVEPTSPSVTAPKKGKVVAAQSVEIKAEVAASMPATGPLPAASIAPPVAEPKLEEKAVGQKQDPAAPKAETAADAPKSPAVDEKKSEPAQRIAFVIEDDFDASEIFGKAMEANGLAFEVINTGNLAMERLNQVAPDIVVLDMHLPNVDGTQILAHIRKTDRLAKTLVIVVTADARVGELVKAEADLVVLKPATYTQVRDFASRLLRRHTLS